MSQNQSDQARSLNNPPEITLRTGQKVTINPIPWETYKRIKSRIIDSIGGELGTAAASVAESIQSADGEGGWLAGVVNSKVIDKLPQLLSQVSSDIDYLIEDLIEGCCLPAPDSGPIIFDLLHALDVLKLRNLIANSDELMELFDAEKNCYLGIWNSVTSLLGLSGTSQIPGQDDVGGVDSNTSSDSPTTGDRPS